MRNTCQWHEPSERLNEKPIPGRQIEGQSLKCCTADWGRVSEHSGADPVPEAPSTIYTAEYSFNEGCKWVRNGILGKVCLELLPLLVLPSRPMSPQSRRNVGEYFTVKTATRKPQALGRVLLGLTNLANRKLKILSSKIGFVGGFQAHGWKKRFGS